MPSKAAASEFLNVFGWVPSDLGDVVEFSLSYNSWVGVYLELLPLLSLQSG